ncbi:MAG: nitroreductase family protein [Maricaulaceae bacterium]
MSAFIPLTRPPYDSDADALHRVRTFQETMSTRRSVRFFSDKPVPHEIIEWAILTAGSAPSGAHKQPWTFVAVSDPALKARIREAAEAEERAFYAGRAGQAWLDDLKAFGTDAEKPFLEIAPWLIVVFQHNYQIDPDTGDRLKTYYVHESVGLATGLLLAALHQAGLSTLTHTPSPMKFLADVLERPENERAVMIVVAGHATEDAVVPDIRRKTLDEIAIFKESAEERAG